MQVTVYVSCTLLYNLILTIISFVSENIMLNWSGVISLLYNVYVHEMIILLLSSKYVIVLFRTCHKYVHLLVLCDDIFEISKHTIVYGKFICFEIANMYTSQWTRARAFPIAKRCASAVVVALSPLIPLVSTWSRYL